MSRPRCDGPGRRLRALLGALLSLGILLIHPTAMQAGPVEWHEVPATTEGRQWWDSGSLRLDRQGHLSVLSRFQPAPPADGDGAEEEKPAGGSLYVMQIDCDQSLYRDTSVNGLPRWNPDWLPVAGDGLSAAVLREACAAATALAGR